MKKYIPISFLTLLFLTLYGCDSQKKVTKLKIITPQAGNSIHQGQPILVKLEIPSNFAPLDSIHYSIDGQAVVSSHNTDSITIPTDTLAFGSKTIGAKIFANGKTETAFSNIVIVPKAPTRYSFKIIRTLEHDPEAFTQGLEINNGFFFESTGQYDGRSSLRKVEINTGKVVKKISLANEYFGEGMTIIGNKIYQLTYLERKAFVYDLSSFNKISEFTYGKKIKEGWGLCFDGKDLILSEGSQYLHFINPEDFSISKTISVFNQHGPIDYINELEYVDGIIYANIYQTDLIVMIDAKTGAVIGEINLVGIYPDKNKQQYDNELNGIAYDPSDRSFYVTGKKWSKMFQIELTAL